MSKNVPVHHYTCLVCLVFFGITCTMTFQLIYWGTYPEIHPKINLPLYLHSSLSSNHKDLPVTTTACVHAHRCTRSGPYVFIFILSFRLTVKIYPSMFLLFYMSIYVPVHHYTCSICFFFFGIICTLKQPLQKSNDSSVGPGCVHYKLLTNLPESSLTLLLTIFNSIWESGIFPPSWRKATNSCNTKSR